jgi:hypothetical protein
MKQPIKRYFFGTLVAALSFSPMMQAQTNAAPAEAVALDRETDSRVIEFAGAINGYVDVVLKNSEGSETPKDLSDATIAELNQFAEEAAEIYFDLAPEDAKLGEDMLKYLSDQFADRKAFQDQFLFLGNAFARKADKILSQPRQYGPRSYRYTKIGAGIGLVVVVITVAVAKGSPGRILLGASLLAAGTALGGYYIDSKQAPVELPVDLEVDTAQKFKERYPNKEDILYYKGPAGGTGKSARLPLTQSLMDEALASLQ